MPLRVKERTTAIAITKFVRAIKKWKRKELIPNMKQRRLPAWTWEGTLKKMDNLMATHLFYIFGAPIFFFAKYNNIILNNIAT